MEKSQAGQKTPALVSKVRPDLEPVAFPDTVGGVSNTTDECNEQISAVVKNVYQVNHSRSDGEEKSLGELIDRSLHALTARATGGLAPAALIGAYMDWAAHLSTSPGKRMELLHKALKKSARLAAYQQACLLSGGKRKACIEPLPQDKRFSNEAWQQWPYNIMYQSFLLQQQWWHNATTSVRGVTRQHENVVEFASRQLLDMASPSNFLMTNPELLQRTVGEGGANLVRGARNFMEDWERLLSGKRPASLDAYKVGKNLAITPGKVVFRNHLIELIQYQPVTEQVHPEPILIVPSWIMKYYILDLSADTSLVKYLTGQGFTVFMISWRNPTARDRDLGMIDYHSLGVLAALDAVGRIVPQQPVHAMGYCLGGTLLSITAAAMARDSDQRLKSLTLLAAQGDFTEAGELTLFINESQLSFLEDMMWNQGYLTGEQMGATFQLLRSNDLIWSRMLREYLMGERSNSSDMMAWNADGTRMPYRMHSEYLRKLFLDNDLAEGRFKVDGKPVVLTDIRVPIFAVSTEKDHVAPWRSVYKLHLLTDTEVTFLLASGGHNGGIVSAPGHPHRFFQVATKAHDAAYTNADEWVETTPRSEGSWWPEWVAWLAERSAALTTPPATGAPDAGLEPLCDAPGTYVLQE